MSSVASTGSSIDDELLDMVRRQALASSQSLRSATASSVSSDSGGRSRSGTSPVAAAAAPVQMHRWRRPAFSGRRTVMSAIDADAVSALSLGPSSSSLESVVSEDSFAL